LINEWEVEQIGLWIHRSHLYGDIILSDNFCCHCTLVSVTYKSSAYNEQRVYWIYRASVNRRRTLLDYFVNMTRS